MSNPKNNKKCDFSKFLEWSLESYYWLGFLLADGNFQNNSIKLTLSCQDLEHLTLYSNFVGSKIYIDKPQRSKYGLSNSCTVSSYDSVSVPCIRQKFGLSSRKTYNPPIFSSFNLTTNEMMALIIGFIDGDGTVSPSRYRIAIELHSSWETNLKFIYEFIYRYTRNLTTSDLFINNRNNAYMSIGKTEIIRNMKYFIEIHSLPVIKRKWDSISAIPPRTENITSSKYASKCNPITVEGNIFGSISEAARYYNCNNSTIKKKISS